MFLEYALLFHLRLLQLVVVILLICNEAGVSVERLGVVSTQDRTVIVDLRVRLFSLLL